MDALTLDELVDLAAHDPVAVTRFVDTALSGDPTTEERAGLYLVTGVAARARNDIRSAVDDLRSAVAMADRHGHDQLAARARVSLAAALAYDGDVHAALRTCRRAIPRLRGRDRLAAMATEAGLLVRSGQVIEADASLGAALKVARRLGDDDWIGRICNNRAIVSAERGDTRRAWRDLDTAERSFTAVDAHLDLVDVLANRAWIAGLTGDLPTAIRLSEQAEAGFRQLDVGDASATVAADRALAMLRGGLISEAERTAAHAIRLLDEQRMVIDAAECRLVAAEAALAAGRVDDGLAAIHDVAELRRGAWNDRTIVLTARLHLARDMDRADVGLLRRVRRAARRLEARGLGGDAVRAHLLAADLAVRSGGRPRVDLQRAVESPQHGRRSASARIDRSIAVARLALLDGDAGDARRAVRRGLRVLADHRIALGGEAALAAAHAGRDLERLTAQVAAATNGPTRLIDDVELARLGGEGRLTAVAAQHDPVVAELLADIRRHDQIAGRDDRAVAKAERALRLHLLADSPAGDATRPSPRSDWLDALDGRTAVVFADDGTDAMAAVVDGQSARLVRLGTTEALRWAARHLRHALGRAARTGNAAVADDVCASVGSAFAAALPDDPTRGIVIVPSGGWNEVCWSLLPQLRGAPVSVVPSLRVLASTRERWSMRGSETSTGRVAAVHGPGLPHAVGEVQRVIDTWGASASLVDREELLRAMAVTDVVHAACHGRLRSDSPLFSSLQLEGGPVRWHDLVAHHRLPGVFVLAACDVGATPSTEADIPIGGPSALLAAGAASVIASMGPVNDAAAGEVVVDLHRRLAAGERPSVALASVETSALVPLVNFGW